MSYLLQYPYHPSLDIRQTEVAIKQIKDKFETELAKALCLTRVSAPMLVFPNTGLNDNLNGVERPVAFECLDIPGQTVEVVHSLAKWKRAALKRYGFREGEGLYTDMNAIRRDEELDNMHSIYVDQWDWEKIIRREDRTRETLVATVNTIFAVFKEAEAYIAGLYPALAPKLPDTLTILSAQELENRYPDLTPKQREDAICKEYGAVFLTQIGGKLRSGKPHDGRAPDYDDWLLNGDMLFWYPLLGIAFEVTSMGIRVDEDRLRLQVAEAGCAERLALPFHSDVLEKRLPYTMGGGLGQSRICMYLLNKAHVGEVHASVWPAALWEQCEKENIHLL